VAEKQASGVELIEVAGVRPMPAPRRRAVIQLWGREIGPVAVAATAGAAAGIAAMAIVRATRPARRPPRRGFLRRREKVVASRSFLVDVHILGR
jgi:hypothetical protein